MRWVRYVAILVVLVLVEGSLPPLLRPFGATPDLLICFAAALALHANTWRVFGPLYGIGIARDLLSLGPFGLYAVLIAGLGMLFFTMRETLFRHHVLTLVAIGGFFSFGLGLAALLRLWMAGTPAATFPALGRLLVAAVLTGAATPIVVKGLLHLGALRGFVPAREMEGLL